MLVWKTPVGPVCYPEFTLTLCSDFVCVLHGVPPPNPQSFSRLPWVSAAFLFTQSYAPCSPYYPLPNIVSIPSFSYIVSLSPKHKLLLRTGFKLRLSHPHPHPIIHIITLRGSVVICSHAVVRVHVRYDIPSPFLGGCLGAPFFYLPVLSQQWLHGGIFWMAKAPQ